MPTSAAPPPESERRADSRLALAATVRMMPREGGVGTSGTLVNVSAGGICIQCEGRPPNLVPGDRVEVEIRVKDGGRNDGPPSVEFRGAATVTRIARAGTVGTLAAARFAAPLGMPEPFAQLLLF